MGFLILRISSGHYSQVDNNHKPQFFLYSGWHKVARFGLARIHQQAINTFTAKIDHNQFNNSCLKLPA
jgi:hypothetical protein